jgi:hypothetical protein
LSCVLFPADAQFSILIDLPKRNASTGNAHHPARTFRMRIEVPVPEQASHKDCCFADVNGKMDYAVMSVTQTTAVEVIIAAEESRSSLLYQEGDYLLILHPLAPDVESNLPNWNSPPLKEFSLRSRDVFV